MVSNKIRKDRSFQRYLIFQSWTNPDRVTHEIRQSNILGESPQQIVLLAFFALHIRNFPISGKFGLPKFNAKEGRKKPPLSKKTSKGGKESKKKIEIDSITSYN